MPFSFSLLYRPVSSFNSEGGGGFVQCPFGTNLTPSFQDQQILKKKKDRFVSYLEQKTHTHKRNQVPQVISCSQNKEQGNTREYDVFSHGVHHTTSCPRFSIIVFFLSSSSREGNPSSPSQACSCPQLRHFPCFGHSEHLLDEHT